MNLSDGVYRLGGASVAAIYLGAGEVYRRAVPVERFDEPFDARDTDGTAWTYREDVGSIVIDGMARFVPDPTGALDCAIEGAATADRPIADSVVTVELILPGDEPFCDIFLDVTQRDVETGDIDSYWMSLDFTMGDLVHYGWTDGSTQNTQKFMPFDRVMMRWLRLRFTGGFVYSEYSPDGIDWTLFHSMPWAGESHPRYRATLSAYSDPGISEVAFDNFSWAAV